MEGHIKPARKLGQDGHTLEYCIMQVENEVYSTHDEWKGQTTDDQPLAGHHGVVGSSTQGQQVICMTGEHDQDGNDACS